MNHKRMGEPKTLSVHFGRFDTILLRSQEQNRPSQPTRNMPEKSMQKSWLPTFLLGLLGLVGCGQGTKTQTKSPEPTAASRPALKVWIVDAPELEKEISVRWQAASDQALKIENLNSRDLLSREPFNPDVLICPGVVLGDLVRTEAIGRLPAEAVMKTDSSASLESLMVTWPVRWRNIASFGGNLYAVPLGATGLAITMHGLDPAPLQEMQKILGDSKELKAQSIDLWNQFLLSAESSLIATEADRQKMLDERFAKISEAEKAYLLDRFLFIASTTNARNRGLFDLLKMEARLDKPEFIATAKILARLVRLFPDAMLAEPANAWETATTSGNNVSFAIGWPNTAVANLEPTPSESNKAIVAPMVWNPCRGLIASVGRKTKQTAVSCQFLRWLSEPDQRDAMRAVCPRIELMTEQIDRNSGREDYRAFQAVNSRDSRIEPMELSLRMARSDQYRTNLADDLISAIQTPEQIERIMTNSAMKWNALTTQFGIDAQRSSEEQSLGFRK